MDAQVRQSVTPFFQTGSPLVAEQRVSSRRIPEWLTEGCLPTAGNPMLSPSSALCEYPTVWMRIQSVETTT